MSLLPSTFTNPATVEAMELAAASTGSDYKCVVSFFMFGATDSHNMVVPYGPSNPNTAIYESVRQPGARIEQSELASSTLGEAPEWALHPSLQFFLTKWNAGELAIVRDVGVLNKPTTRAQYLSGDPSFVPRDLFAHNIQVETWQAALPFLAARTTGWMGRLANLVDDYFNPNTSVGSGSISVAGTAQQMYAYPPKLTPNYPAVAFPSGSDYSTNPADFAAIRDSFFHSGEYNSPFFSQLPVQVNRINEADRKSVV